MLMFCLSLRACCRPADLYSQGHSSLNHVPMAGPKAVVSFWKVLVGHMAPLTFSMLFSLCVLRLLGFFFFLTFL